MYQKNNLKLEIKYIDFDTENIAQGIPFSMAGEVEIGTIGNDGADLFRFSICNVSGLANMLKDEYDVANNIISLNSFNLIVVEEFDPIAIKSWIRKELDQIEETSSHWVEAAKKIGKMFWWEYHYEH